MQARLKLAMIGGDEELKEVLTILRAIVDGIAPAGHMLIERQELVPIDPPRKGAAMNQEAH